MARLIDENFKSTGYSINPPTEVIAAGCSLDEATLVSSFTAGTTAPATFYGHCMKISTDGDATNGARASWILPTAISTFYARVDVILVTAIASESNVNSIFYMGDSADANAIFLYERWLASTGYHTRLSTPKGNIIHYGVLLNTKYTYELFWSRTANQCELRCNTTSLGTVVFPSTSAVDYKYFSMGCYSGYTGAVTMYLDNFRLNDDTGDINNSWPGTSYDEPLMEIDFLSTQRFIGMSL